MNSTNIKVHLITDCALPVFEDFNFGKNKENISVVDIEGFVLRLGKFDSSAVIYDAYLVTDRIARQRCGR